MHVRDGYARNYLLPKGLAEPVTKNALRKLDKIRKEREAEGLPPLDEASDGSGVGAHLPSPPAAPPEMPGDPERPADRIH